LLEPSVMPVLLLLSLIGTWNVDVDVDAFPTQAGGCQGGRAAVNGAHLNPAKEIETGSLDSVGLEVAINGIALEADSIFTITPGVDHVISLTATDSDTPFRGFLLRLGWPEQLDREPLWSLTPGINAQIAAVCFLRAAGVTHTGNFLKDSASGTFRVDEEIEGFTLDVTVVLANNETDSHYYYSGYEINSILLAETEVPTESETTLAPETPAATAVRTSIPSDILSDVPSDVRSDIPSDAPSDAPSDVPSGVPSSSPTIVRRPCGTEEVDLRVCYESFEDYRTCDSCVANRIPASVDTCADLELTMCTAIAECGCEPCAAELEGYLDCAFDVALGCTIVCTT